jgi:hypothetical protein
MAAFILVTVRRTLTFAVAILLLGLTSIDPILCPDGCTDDAVEYASDTSPTVDCAICHGLSPAVVLPAIVLGDRAGSYAVPVPPYLYPAQLKPIERPPRA